MCAVDTIESAKFLSTDLCFPLIQDLQARLSPSLYLILTTSDNVLPPMTTPKTNRLVILIT